jgi:hypothetical protein
MHACLSTWSIFRAFREHREGLIEIEAMQYCGRALGKVDRWRSMLLVSVSLSTMHEYERSVVVSLSVFFTLCGIYISRLAGARATRLCARH